MQKSRCHFSFLKLLLLAVLSVLQVACNIGVGGSSATAATADSQAAYDVNLAGSVGDGPVTGATVEVWSAQGRLLKTMLSDYTASFNSRLRVKRSSYPLLLKVRGGVDLVTGAEPDFQMASVVLDRYSQQVNINPFSTLIVRIAQGLPGGVNATNVGTARDIVTGQLGFGLDQSLIADPINSTLTNENIANLVKSSETLGEMIRRTRDLVTTAGRAVSGDDIMAALVADIQDGNLDGVGANGTDAQISVVAKVAAGQVLVEALSNNLKVNGVIATLVIDQAIVTTRAYIGTDGLTQNVRATAGMLQQTRGALAAARVLDSSAEIAALEQVVSGIAAGTLPGDVAMVLPADASRALDNAILLAVTADSTQLASINSTGPTAGAGDTASSEPAVPVATATDSTTTVTTAPETTTTDTSAPVIASPETTTGTTAPETTTPVNHAPVISGTPGGTVQAGTAYSFQPTASDVDGDRLVFSIAGRPTWAAFDTVTGLLAGTPQDTNTGTYHNITIAVTDGTDTATLQPFSIVVDPVQGMAGGITTGTLGLTWTAPVARTDGSSMSLSEIGGYHIHYGTAAGVYTKTIDVNDGTVQVTSLSGLTPGTYYLVMTTYDTNGLASAYSPEVVKIVY